MPQVYDEIGAGYARARRPDPRIARQIARALGGAATIVNVGAGTGSYEPEDRTVVAVEPSQTMIAQRPEGSAPVVQASAVALPFRDDAFDAALAILTVHHWPDRRRGLAELRRVAREGAAVVTWDPESADFWVGEYFPDLVAIDRRIFPPIDAIREALGACRVEAVAIPHDCADGFLGSYWRRPAAFLDARVRGGISTFARVSELDDRLERLRRDLDDGTWARRYGELLAMGDFDAGYRLVISGALADKSEQG